jgi:hypothetical protein
MVTRIGIDLTPIVLHVVEYEDYSISFDPKITIIPQYDEENKLLVATDPKIGLNAYASARSELENEIYEQLKFLRETYACSDDEMTDSAIQIKHNLRNVVYEV